MWYHSASQMKPVLSLPSNLKTTFRKYRTLSSWLLLHKQPQSSLNVSCALNVHQAKSNGPQNNRSGRTTLHALNFFFKELPTGRQILTCGSWFPPLQDHNMTTHINHIRMTIMFIKGNNSQYKYCVHHSMLLCTNVHLAWINLFPYNRARKKLEKTI